MSVLSVEDIGPVNEFPVKSRVWSDGHLLRPLGHVPSNPRFCSVILYTGTALLEKHDTPCQLQMLFSLEVFCVSQLLSAPLESVIELLKSRRHCKFVPAHACCICEKVIKVTKNPNKLAIG